MEWGRENEDKDNRQNSVNDAWRVDGWERGERKGEEQGSGRKGEVDEEEG